MIRNDSDLARSFAALSDLHRAVAALHREYAAAGLDTFGLLAEGPLHEIEKVQWAIDEYTGARTAREQQAQLWVRLVGPRARWGETSASIVTAFIDALRKGVQSIAGFQSTERRLGRPSIELQRACDFEIAQFAPGSFEVGVRLPDAGQGELFPSELHGAATSALQQFLAAAAWAAQSGSNFSHLEAEFPDPEVRRVVLRAVKPFVPRYQGGVNFVELFGSAVTSHARISLSPRASDVISVALTSAVEESEESYVGEIREMDLDKRLFRLRNVPTVGEVQCQFAEGLAPAAAELLGRTVRVVGTRRSVIGNQNVQLTVIDIERIDDGASAS